MNKDHPKYDRSLLPEAMFEFVVLGDTHFILDPEPYAVEFDSVREWPQRGAWAWRSVASLDTEVVVHLGDMTEENAARPQQPESRQRAVEQFKQYDIRPNHVAGNMDIGDKPDATMWTEWVTPESLKIFYEKFGKSWYSFDNGDVHFIVLNSQIINGPLSEAGEQQAWFENDLAKNKGRRIVVFMHMPPFFVEESEPDTGFYNSINEPGRSWLTGLMREYGVECLFTGHTHFRVFNRIDDTRFYVCPSTTTSRAGFYEAFSVAPAPEQGRNDPAKLGFYLVRVYEDSIGVYFIRTHGQAEVVDKEGGWQRLVCRKTQDLPHSPVGLYMRTPLTSQSVGALAWPSVLRQRVRDDHPFLQLLEAGVRHVRVPVSDLSDPLQNSRLQLLRDEGVDVTSVWVWSDRLDLLASVGEFADQMDIVELQIPGERFPDKCILEKLSRCRERYDKPVILTPVIARETTKGTYHPRTRFGYRVEELDDLDRHLAKTDTRLDRIFCHIDVEDSPWDAIIALGKKRLGRVAAFDYVVRLPGADEEAHIRYVAEALLAVATQPGSRVFIDPFVDLDRTNDFNLGLIDRLSNPRPAYNVMQCLNTALFGQNVNYRAMPVQMIGENRVIGIEGSGCWHQLLMTAHDQSDVSLIDAFDIKGKAAVLDLVQGWRRVEDNAEDAFEKIVGPNRSYLVSHNQDIG